MRILLAPLAAFALLGTFGLAAAEEAAGPITKIDLPADSIQVGEVFLKLEGVSVEGFKLGDTVKVEFFVGDDGNHLQRIVKE